jgi:hypothetical protein
MKYLRLVLVGAFMLILLSNTFAIQTTHYYFSKDSINRKINRKTMLFLDVGYALNYSKIASTQFSAPIGYELKAFPSASYGFGFIRWNGPYFAGIKIKHVRIGDKQSIDASFVNSAPTNIYVSVSKPNFFLSIFGGFSFNLAKIKISPYLGGEYSLTPNLNSKIEGQYSVQGDSLFVIKQTKLVSNKILLLQSGFITSVPIKIGTFKFQIAYNLSYSRGFKNAYFSNTKFYSKDKAYIFTNDNKGSHLINTIQFYFPLSR